MKETPSLRSVVDRTMREGQAVYIGLDRFAIDPQEVDQRMEQLDYQVIAEQLIEGETDRRVETRETARATNNGELRWSDRDLATELADPTSKHPDAQWRQDRGVEEDLDRGLSF